MEMMNEKKMMYCPLCEEEHPVEVKKRSVVGLIKEEKVTYEEVYFVCCEEDEEFITAKQMDANLLTAKNAYCELVKDSSALAKQKSDRQKCAGRKLFL